MERTTKQRLQIQITPQTTLWELKGFLDKAKPDARLRLEGDVLFVRDERKGDNLSQAATYLSGKTAGKREVVWERLASLFAPNHMDFESHVNQVLSPEQIKALRTGQGDLKVEHLLRILPEPVNANGKALMYDRFHPIGEGSYGKVYKAIDPEGKAYALKQPMKSTPQEADALRREADAQARARKAKRSDNNYVVSTKPVVVNPHGGVVQPMAWALCNGLDMMKKFKVPETEHSVNLLARQTVFDWVKGVGQVGRAGMAHRDIKPENWLLSKKGVWQVSDFGTSGPEETTYPANPLKKGYRVTGNGGVRNKSPEWLRSEQAPDNAVAYDPNGTFTVGHKADVFSLGVAVFRLITGDSFPFKPPSSQDDRETTYMDNVLEYADSYKNSGKPFSQWYSEWSGLEVPEQWRSFLDRALHADPEQRASADELLNDPVFDALQGVDEAELRRGLVEMANGH